MTLKSNPLISLSAGLLVLPLVGCGTLSGARPLSPGQHEVGVVLGGPMLSLFGTPMPLPNLVVAGRSGLTNLANRPVDLGYGLNVTGLPFGITSLQSDLGWMAIAPKGARPAITVRNGVFLATNLFGSNKVEDARRGVWFADELEVLASWKTREHLVWVSLSQFTDVRSPALTLTPAIGVSLNPGEATGLRFQTEISWYAISQSSDQTAIDWLPSRPGAIGVHLGLAYGFGSAK